MAETSFAIPVFPECFIPAKNILAIKDDYIAKKPFSHHPRDCYTQGLMAQMLLICLFLLLFCVPCGPFSAHISQDTPLPSCSCVIPIRTCSHLCFLRGRDGRQQSLCTTAKRARKERSSRMCKRTMLCSLLPEREGLSDPGRIAVERLWLGRPSKVLVLRI